MCQALVDEGLPIVGCSPFNTEIHSTEYGATFIPCEDKYVRIDWERKPTLDEKNRAKKVVVQKCGEQADDVQSIGSDGDIYPADVPPPPARKISEITAFHFYPRVWIGESPRGSETELDLESIVDEIYRDTLITGIRIKILRFGLFIFDFSASSFKSGTELERSSYDEIADLQLRRLAVLNVFLLCIHVAHFRIAGFGFTKMLLSPMDTINIKVFDDPYHSYSSPKLFDEELPRLYELTHEFFRHVSYGETLYYNAQVKWQMENHRRLVLPITVINDSLSLLVSIMQHPDQNSLLLINMFAHACKAYQDFNYSFCLVTCWTIAEQLLQRLWGRYIDEQRRKDIEVEGKKVSIISKDRKSRLEDGRTFTASVIAEFLAFENVISFQTYDLLSAVRTARNNWVHKLREVNSTQANQSAELVKIMLNDVESIDLPVPISNALFYQTEEK